MCSVLGSGGDTNPFEGAALVGGLSFIPLPRCAVDRVAIGVDLSKLYYSGPRGVQAPDATEDIGRYVRLAEREMNKKVARRRC